MLHSWVSKCLHTYHITTPLPTPLSVCRQPMGVLALLDEECLFPKGSDKSYLEKLNKTHADKSSNYHKAEKSRAQMAEFEIAHYAGTVSRVQELTLRSSY